MLQMVVMLSCTRDMLLGQLVLANIENVDRQFEECIKSRYLSMEIGNMLMHG